MIVFPVSGPMSSAEVTLPSTKVPFCTSTGVEDFSTGGDNLTILSKFT
ncbi:MAG TPA: hypothetical protein VHJ38_13420 [Nitrososphaeraceae archaeon]|nr:hypothetical protein [Nitrososphaeraceae archaeon]